MSYGIVIFNRYLDKLVFVSFSLYSKLIETPQRIEEKRIES